MSGFSFLWRIVAEEVVRRVSAHYVSKALADKREQPTRIPKDGFINSITGVKQKHAGPPRNKIKDDSLKKALNPFDTELGNALATFLSRCDLIRENGKDAVFSHRDSLFSLAETLQELESRAGSRALEISGFLRVIETALNGEYGAAERTANQLYEMLSGKKAA